MSRRIRKHANPFNVQTVLGHIDRQEIFGRIGPIEVDIGCGGGAFLIERAQAHPELDFVGLEVRKPLVEAAMEARRELGLKNLVFFYASSFLNILLTEPGGIHCFHIQFPDPCFKKRHQKRRICQPKSVRAMAEVLPLGGRVHLQSDVHVLAEEMHAFMSQDNAFANVGGKGLDTLEKQFPESTEWERQHQKEREPIYRMMFEKVREASGPIHEPDFRDTNPMRLEADARDSL